MQRMCAADIVYTYSLESVCSQDLQMLTWQFLFTGLRGSGTCPGPGSAESAAESPGHITRSRHRKPL